MLARLSPAALARRLRRSSQPPSLPSSIHPEADSDARRIVDRTNQFTMTGPARLFALIEATRYCVRRDLPGAFAECGVWRGGSVLAMIMTLQSLGRSDRDIYLFDTFEGMTAPGEHDVSEFDPPAMETWRAAAEEGSRPWSVFFDGKVFNEDSVRETVLSTGYPEDRLHLVRGRVEDTVPGSAPDRLALLRLDTDWYESTRHEMEHLYPRLATGGVLIVDDYGHWQGSRRAVDEYLEAAAQPLLLNRIDYAARIATKP